MREIKLRAWDTEKKVMTVGNTDLSFVGDCWQDLDFPLMQYTGLKDKNGVEIYEGDILRIYWYGDQIGIVSFNDDNFGSVLGWNMLKPNGEAIEYYYGRPPTDEDVVIGNIYENPDLLK